MVPTVVKVFWTSLGPGKSKKGRKGKLVGGLHFLLAVLTFTCMHNYVYVLYIHVHV